MEIGEKLEASSPKDFAAWLESNGGNRSEIWVVIYKKGSGKQIVTYPELVEVGIAYGWIDSTSKTIDDERYAQRFSPRRPGSKWTEANRAIARRLMREGLMTEAGKTTLPEDLLANDDRLAGS